MHLPDVGCELAASLRYVHGDGQERALFPCVLKRCCCAGVFFTCVGATACVQLRVWVQAPHGVTPEVDTLVSRLFRRTKPEWALIYSTVTGESVCEQHSHEVYVRRVFEPDATRLGGGVWVFSCRPVRVTGDDLTARLQVTFGSNVLSTGGFEVRSKITNWLLLQHVPCSATKNDVLSACVKFRPMDVVFVRGCERSSRTNLQSVLLKFANRTETLTTYETFTARRTQRRATFCPTPSYITSVSRMHVAEARGCASLLSQLAVPETDVEHRLVQLRYPTSTRATPRATEGVVLPTTVDLAAYSSASAVDCPQAEELDHDDHDAVVLPLPTLDILYLPDASSSPCSSPVPTASDLLSFDLTPLRPENFTCW